MDRQTFGLQEASDINNGNKKCLPTLDRLYVQIGFVCVWHVCVRVFPPPQLRKEISENQEMHYRVLYAILVHFLAETQIYCGEKVIDELTRDSDILASVQETLKN